MFSSNAFFIHGATSFNAKSESKRNFFFLLFQQAQERVEVESQAPKFQFI